MWRYKKMKLKEFNAENTTTTRGGGVKTPAIGINLKTGLFNINKTACELMEIKLSDSIVILQDEEEKENWYIEKVKAKGFQLKEKANVTSGLLFNNTTMARAIAESIKFTGVSGKALVAGKPTIVDKRKLWGLILSGFVS